MDLNTLLLSLAAAIFIGVVFAWLRVFRRPPGLDALTLIHLERAGSNVQRVHPVEFFLYFPDQPAAERAAVKVAALGMQVATRPGADGRQWLVFATKNMVPTEREMARLRIELNAIAAAEQGEYDGWGSPVVK